MEIMIRSHFDTLRRRKAARENRDITLRDVAHETGLSTSTIQRVKDLTKGDVTLTTINRLLGYFEAKSIGELLEYTKDATAQPEQAGE